MKRMHVHVAVEDVHEGARVAHTGACSEPAAKAEAVSCGCPA
jgi:hypothetical protein